MQVRNTFFVLFIATLFSFHVLAQQKFSTATTFKLPEKVTAADYENGKIIFKLKPEFRSSGIHEPSLEKILSSLKTKSVKKLFPNHQPPVHEKNAAGQPLVDLS